LTRTLLDRLATYKEKILAHHVEDQGALFYPIGGSSRRLISPPGDHDFS